MRSWSSSTSGRKRAFNTLVIAALFSGCQGQLGNPGGASRGNDGAAFRSDDPGSVGSGTGGAGTGGSSNVAVSEVAAESKSLCVALGDKLSPGSSPLRLLTRREYDNTVRDLLGVTTKPAQAFGPDADALGFTNNATQNKVDALRARDYKAAAEAMSESVTEKLANLRPCLESAPDDSCLKDFINDLGGRAYRRPLSSEEATRLFEVLNWGKTNETLRVGIKLVLQVLLQSPHFLYRVELDSTPVVAQQPDVVRLSNYEMATRLSYFYWGTMPDAALFAAAARGELSTKEQVLAQAQRLLADPRAKDTVLDFFSHWLHLDKIDKLDRSPDVYPGYTSAIPALLKQEVNRFVEYVVFTKKAGLQELLTATYTFMNGELAQFYGASGPKGSEFELVQLDASKHAGVLTKGGVMASLAQSLQTSPVHRGKWIREQVMCQILKPPPSNLVIQPPDLDPTLSTRDRFSQHRDNPSCAECHQYMDPVGFGFEGFDPVGRYRATENGLPVDSSGELVNSDVPGKFNGAAELGAKLGSSADVASCFAQQWVRYSYGRSETNEDACTVDLLKTAVDSGKGSILDLLLDVARTDAFLYRKAEL